MNTQQNINELEQMRQEMSSLKRRLNQQEIVNEKVAGKYMRSKMNWIKTYILLEAFVGLPLLGVFFAGFAAAEIIPWWFFAFTMIGTVADVWADWKVNILRASDFLSENLLQTGRRLQQMKQARMKQFYISLPFLIFWALALGWFVLQYGAFDFVQRLDADLVYCIKIGMAVGVVVGSIVGIWVALVIIRKMQHTNDDLIRQINEMKEGE